VALDQFFEAAEAGTFAERFADVSPLFDALADTAVHALFGEDAEPLRKLTQRDLEKFFVNWLDQRGGMPSLPEPLQGAGTLSERRARTWFHQLRQAGLFFADGSEGFVFVHSTVLEFLAARYFAEHQAAFQAALSRSGRDMLETVPMLCGRSWEGGTNC
jgi:hypothetical protein